ncbi:NAD(P)-dependent oxidoreductase [Pannus brasiliensis CCIBt3594]|uniref:NAD(P)-dependent oxidoreductase n=1 Tax=Pannus brasiliensis CCIBt3594 TaxID=1427578 RepID=A0AAW9QF13_9CHRO
MKVGFLGTGLMGAPMVERLVTAGVPTIAYNRTAAKLNALREIGAEITGDPREAIESSTCLVLMLTNAAAIEDVLGLNAENSSLSDRTIIQMGTIGPSESKAILDRVTAKGGEYLEAPVLGSIPEAKTGKLLVMVGSTETQFQKWSGLLNHFGSEPMWIGEVGTASAVKLALNQLIASLTGAFAMSLAFLERQDVDIEKFMAILRQSALYAPTFDKKLARMLDRNYENPNFPTKHLLKDVNLFLEEAGKENITLFPLEGVREILRKAIEQGWSEADYSALYSAF